MILGKDGRKVEEANGLFGKITDVSELPNDEILIQFVQEAIKLVKIGKVRSAKRLK